MLCGKCPRLRFHWDGVQKNSTTFRADASVNISLRRDATQKSTQRGFRILSGIRQIHAIRTFTKDTLRGVHQFDWLKLRSAVWTSCPWGRP